MKTKILLLIVLFLSGCELIDLESKLVSYTIDESKQFIYYSKIFPGQQFNDVAFISRASFDIPESAEVEKFIVKNVYLDFIVQEVNDCNELIIDYVFDSDFTGFLERISDAQINIDLPAYNDGIGELLMNNNFTDDFQDIRNRISDVILNNGALGLKFRMYCNEQLQADVQVRVTIDIISEYENCELMPEGTNLPEC